MIYLNLEQSLEIHKKTVEISGGGNVACLDTNKLEGILKFIQHDFYYPTFEDKLTYLFYSVCQYHCFMDGNKRMAIVLCAQILLLNGYLYCASEFIREMENISYYVAAGKIDKELLLEIITALINEDMENETLKLKIINAISEDNL